MSFELWSCLPSRSPRIAMRLNDNGPYEVPWVANEFHYELLMRFTVKVVHKSEQFLYFYIIFKLTNLEALRYGIFHDMFSLLISI